MPSTPISASVSTTLSSLNGCTIASIFFIEGRSKLVGVLFERYPYKLSAGPHAGLLEQALQDGLYVALGNLQTAGDLLVGKSFQHEAQDFSLPLVELRTCVPFGPGRLLRGEVRITFVQPGMAARHHAHALGKYAERTLFQENTGHTLTDQPARFRIAYPCGDDQDTAGKPDLARGGKELRSPLRAQVVVQQNQIHRPLRQRLQGFPNRRAGGHLELRAGRQRASHALPENGMIVHQQRPDSVHDTPMILVSAGHNSTTKHAPPGRGS